MGKRTLFKGHKLVFVICRNPISGRYLSINETEDRGWYIPAGFLESGETFQDAAIRKAKDEAGIDIILKGILNISHQIQGDDNTKLNIVYFAEPIDS